MSGGSIRRREVGAMVKHKFVFLDVEDRDVVGAACSEPLSLLNQQTCDERRSQRSIYTFFTIFSD